MTLRRRRPGLVYPVGEDWHYVGEAGEPAFTNSWVNAGSTSPALAFRIRETGILDIQGLVSSGTQLRVFTLPEGYRPPNIVNIPVAGYFSSSGNHEQCLMTVGSNGDVQVSRQISNVGTQPSIAILYAQVFLDPPILSGDL